MSYVHLNTSKGHAADEETKAARMKKNRLSIILEKGDRYWIPVEDSLPDVNEPVAIRFTSEDVIFAEDDENIIFAEDEKVGKLVQSGDSTRWMIVPPYLRYDYSSLSQRDQLLPGTVVTHWGYLQEGELDGWEHRLDPVGEYAHLRIEVSSDYEELVYRALLNGASMIARSVNGNLEAEGNELQMSMYAVLSDLQLCIDHRCHISRGNIVRDVTPGVDDLPEAMEIYKELDGRFSDTPNKRSKIIRALQAIDDDPELYIKILSGEPVEEDEDNADDDNQ